MDTQLALLVVARIYRCFGVVLRDTSQFFREGISEASDKDLKCKTSCGYINYHIYNKLFERISHVISISAKYVLVQHLWQFSPSDPYFSSALFDKHTGQLLKADSDFGRLGLYEYDFAKRSIRVSGWDVTERDLEDNDLILSEIQIVNTNKDFAMFQSLELFR